MTKKVKENTVTPSIEGHIARKEGFRRSVNLRLIRFWAHLNELERRERLRNLQELEYDNMKRNEIFPYWSSFAACTRNRLEMRWKMKRWPDVWGGRTSQARKGHFIDFVAPFIPPSFGCIFDEEVQRLVTFWYFIGEEHKCTQGQSIDWLCLLQ